MLEGPEDGAARQAVKPVICFGFVFSDIGLKSQNLRLRANKKLDAFVANNF